MEDISRELEKEIAQTKPEPLQERKDSRVLIVDAFGEIRSGDHLRVMARICFVLGLIGCIVAGSAFYFYLQGRQTQGQLLDRISFLEKQVTALNKDREVLMARLVISGKGKLPVEVKAATEDPLEEAGNTDPKGKPREGVKPEGGSTRLPVSGETQKAAMVSIKDFTFSDEPDKERLRFKFVIQNASRKPGEVSGRIFLVAESQEGRALDAVQPKVALKGGFPVDPALGQYFSISRFKPVEFKFKKIGHKMPYKKATVFIYDEGGQMVCRKSIQLVKES